MPIPASLKKRWHTLGNTRQILAATQNLTISPFDRTEDGLLDFRGIQLIGDERSQEEIAKLPPIAQFPASRVIWHSGVLRDADFSGSQWSDVSVAHQNDGETMRFDNVRFNGSTFKAKNAANFGGLGAHLVACDFDGCAFPKNIAFTRATLQNCRFTRIKKSSRLTFLHSLLENCTFEGDIHKADFDATPMKNCTFSGSLKDCFFRGEFSLAKQDAKLRWKTPISAKPNYWSAPSPITISAPPNPRRATASSAKPSRFMKPLPTRFVSKKPPMPTACWKKPKTAARTRKPPTAYSMQTNWRPSRPNTTTPKPAACFTTAFAKPPKPQAAA